MPTGPQRAAIERRITELRRADRPGPEAEILAHVGDLILEYATARMDDRQVTAKAGAYLDALSSVPAWTVREAITRWRCGPEGVDEAALDFAPRPHRLRAMAERIALVARGQAARLQRILDAEPEEELSDAEREANSRKMDALLLTLSDRDDDRSRGTAHADRLRAQSDLRDREAAIKSKSTEESAA